MQIFVVGSDVMPLALFDEVLENPGRQIPQLLHDPGGAAILDIVLDAALAAKMETQLRSAHRDMSLA